MKKFLILIATVTIIGFVATFFAFRVATPSPSPAFINHAVRASMEKDSVRETVDMLTIQLTQAFEEMDQTRRSRDFVLQVYMYLLIGGLSLMGVILYLYCEQKLFQPFRKLQTFAKQIAAGNLDIPLEMDKDNLFGAFTESFDLMREELRVAKENEQLANKSKKELVASLSHDIKTPVASIQSAMDLMLLKAEDERDRKQIFAVSVKLEQINTLITDMFHATLEELQVLKVTPVETLSTDVLEFIHHADYESRVAPFKIPSCLVLADPMRLQQTFDNIISNSYKYAETDIYVNSFLEDEYLIIAIQDFGAGVPGGEIPLLFNKFYRAKNAEKSAGYGLGLYLSKYFMEHMEGNIICENLADGFVVKLKLRLAGSTK